MCISRFSNCKVGAKEPLSAEDELISVYAIGRRNTLCIPRTMDALWGERFTQNRVNPYVSPPFFQRVKNPKPSLLRLTVWGLLLSHRRLT